MDSLHVLSSQRDKMVWFSDGLLESIQLEKRGSTGQLMITNNHTNIHTKGVPGRGPRAITGQLARVLSQGSQEDGPISRGSGV